MIRYLSIFFVICLYSIPFYQNLIFEKKGGWFNKSISFTDYKQCASDTVPFYHEGFVNMDKPGTICHVSSVSPVIDGKMACTWYSGSREGARDVAIYLSIYDEKTGAWSNPLVVIDRDTCSEELGRYVKKVGNPVLFRSKDGRLWLFYASIFAGGWSGSSINYKISADGGHTWSSTKKMILSPFFNLTNNVKNKGINIDDGIFLLPVYHEFMNSYCQIIWVEMKKGLINYEINRATSGRYIIQPSIIHMGGKNLIAFFRNKNHVEKAFIRSSESTDMGKTWSNVRDTALPNPNSGVDSIELSNGDYLVVINYSFINRSNLYIMISHDRGRSWSVLKVLEDKPEMEYSYPSISRSMSGLYHITYTYERRKIKYIVFNEAWIKNQKEVID